MAVLRLFAGAREAAGVARAEFEGATVGEVLDHARQRYGPRFSAVLGHSRIWVNGAPAEESTAVVGSDVVAVLPPVSGGADPEEGAARAVVADRPSAPAARPAPTARPPRPSPASSGSLPPPEPTRPAPAAPLRSGYGNGAPSRPRPAPPPPERPESVLTMPVEVEAAIARAPGPPPVAPPREPVPTAHRPPARRPRRPPPPKPLAVVPEVHRPHIRLGLVWALLTVACVYAGQGWVAACFSITAGLAALQAARARRGRRERPVPAVTAAVAAGAPLAAVSGLAPLAGFLGAAVLGLLALRVVFPTRPLGRDVVVTLAVAVPVGLAAAAPVLVRDLGVAEVLVLLAYTFAYDAGAYLVGTGATVPWEGMAAGMVATVPVTVFVAAVLVSAFEGPTPLVFGVLAALLAPLGPLAGSALLGDRAAGAPALRRLDSLLLLGPIWAWSALVLLRR